MAGWKILQGHPYEKTYTIYFTYENGITGSTVRKVQTEDLTRKVTWIDSAGRKRTNTVLELYNLFQTFSGQYTYDWLDQTFGKLYSNWIDGEKEIDNASYSAGKLIDEYLISSGQMKDGGNHITLTPETALYYFAALNHLIRGS